MTQRSNRLVKALVKDPVLLWEVLDSLDKAGVMLAGPWSEHEVEDELVSGAYNIYSVCRRLGRQEWGAPLSGAQTVLVSVCRTGQGVNSRFKMIVHISKDERRQADCFDLEVAKKWCDDRLREAGFLLVDAFPDEGVE